MKTLIFFTVVLATLNCFSEKYVNGYLRKSGQFTAGHFKTKPDKSLRNNYSTKGNYNPYNGKKGTINPCKKKPNAIDC